jgi:ATP-dependent DNA helicase RecG
MNSFDEQAIPDLKSEAIDFRAASESFAPYRQMTAQAWTTLRIVTEHQGRQVPTIGGLLLFGKDRFARFPDAWIQAGRFAGTNRTRRLDSAEIRWFLPRGAEEAITFSHKHLTRESIIEGVRQEGSLVGSSRSNPGGALECHSPCGLRPARGAHPHRSV